MTTVKDNGTALRRRAILAAAVSVLGLAASRAEAAGSGMVDLQVVDRETGEVARVWRSGGRLFVAGRPGARYSLRVTNNTGRRVLAVISVDGVNILTGQTAGHGQRGYVFGPYETYDLNGWRKSDTEIAAFHFTSLPRSYAARTGRPDDVGVIGVAAFSERIVRPRAAAPAIVPQSRSRDADEALSEITTTARPAPAPPAGRSQAAPELARRSEKLGTGHGAREWSQVSTVAFERATASPQYVYRVEYDSYANLLASGVIPRPRPVPRRPQPFPMSPDGGGYVPDPPGRR